MGRTGDRYSFGGTEGSEQCIARAGSTGHLADVWSCSGTLKPQLKVLQTVIVWT